MSVHPSDSRTRQIVGFDELEHLFVQRQWSLRKCIQQRQDLPPVPDPAAGDLAHHEGVARDLPALEATREPRIAPAKVIDPDRGIDEHYETLRALRRRMGLSCLSVEPSEANRRALSRLISASKPA